MCVSEKLFLDQGHRATNKMKTIILASASPRRRDLLKTFFKLEILSPDVDERSAKRETPPAYVKRIAHSKWAAIAGRMNRLNDVIVAADTSVVLGREILGKPKNKAHAKKILQKLSGRSHKVLTAVVVGRPATRPKFRLVSTEIQFRKLSRQEINVYLQSGEWKGKAGAYGIQGSAFEWTISVRGSLTSVMGLPLAETLDLIDELL